MNQHRIREKGPLRLVRSRLGFCVAWSSVLVVTTAMFLASGCSSDSKTETEPEGEVHTYVVRGVIRQLPSADDPSKQLLILHEAIPGWVNEQGYETGMPGMTMPFPPGPNVDLSTFAVGDPVLFTLRLNWESAPRLQVTELVHRTE